ncbi:hypothetical protein XENOCAPTIV_027701 [Xenoophorus captivus]|uniref:Uncharacterized protein n=1 Tax=Xenoophorus captivus TaxID=1517983 RepID=A0ABV0RTX6_9TELE
MRTIRCRLRETGLRNADLYSSLSDEELDRMVNEVHRNHPNSGVVRNSVPLKYSVPPVSGARTAAREADPTVFTAFLIDLSVKQRNVFMSSFMLFHRKNPCLFQLVSCSL